MTFKGKKDSLWLKIGWALKSWFPCQVIIDEVQ